MSLFSLANLQRRRAPRVQLDSVPAAIRLDNGTRTRVKIQTISLTGGLLAVVEAFGEGEAVQIAFQTRSGPIQGIAKMLRPTSRGESCMQPFRFVELDNEDSQKLRLAVEAAREQRLDSLRRQLQVAPAL
jgi:PilZ domain